jgi:hypothetical protein
LRHKEGGPASMRLQPCQVPQPQLLLLHLDSDAMLQQQLGPPLFADLAALQLSQALALLALALLSLQTLTAAPSAFRGPGLLLLVAGVRTRCSIVVCLATVSFRSLAPSSCLRARQPLLAND